MDKDFVLSRSNFGLCRKSVNLIVDVVSKELFGNVPVVVEGADLLDTLCPVSNSTGKRCNPLSLLGMLTGAKADVLNSLLQELPVVASNPNLSDEDRAQFVVERCSTGTPAEDALMAKRIMADLDALGLSYKEKESVVSDSSISFSPSDAPDSSKTE